MNSWKSKLYNELHVSYKLATNSPHSVCDAEVSQLWKRFKGDEGFPGNVHKEIDSLRTQFRKQRNRNSLLHYWDKIPNASNDDSSTGEVQFLRTASASNNNEDAKESNVPQQSDDFSNKSFKTPSQDLIRKKINGLTTDITYLSAKKDNGCATEDEIQKLSKCRRELKSEEAKFKDKVSSQKRQQKKRQHGRSVFMRNPDLAKKFKKRSKIGRPPLEQDQPELLKAIVDIATYGSATDERRRSEFIRTVKTLDELTEALRTDGYNISRSGVYLRLQPARCNSAEGKRHVNTVPVRLIKVTNDFHKQHADTMFCKTGIGYLEEIASILGPSNALFISQDDKARVPIGKTAANKQTPILMHMDYRVHLPDHDWVVADKHKLIPSVYGIMEIKTGMIGNPKAVSYSGPTFVAIRSGKHSSSTANSHAKDFDVLLSHPKFIDFTRTTDGGVKPVVFVIVDGGPDENPRYEKVIDCAASHFVRHDLDAIFIATNAPGRSAFNRVERRMTPLSRELCGVILPHDHFGHHLDSQGRTIDVELERQNFHHAGNVLAEVWSSLTIDGFETIATYVDPNESELQNNDSQLQQWKDNHIRESHYFLQIVKCTDRTCCASPRSPYFNVFPRFVPAPLCINDSTLLPDDNTDGDSTFVYLMVRLRFLDSNFKARNGEIPFDLCCPSVKEFIEKRSCSLCGAYFASMKNLKQHKKISSNNPRVSAENSANSLLISRRHNRPIRVAAQRQKQRMVIWTSRLNDSHCDWFDEDELDGVPIEPNVQVQDEPSLPLMNIGMIMNPIWEDE